MNVIAAIALTIYGVVALIGAFCSLMENDVNHRGEPPFLLLTRWMLWPVACTMYIPQALGYHPTPRCARCHAKCRGKHCPNCGRRVQDSSGGNE